MPSKKESIERLEGEIFVLTNVRFDRFYETNAEFAKCVDGMVQGRLGQMKARTADPVPTIASTYADVVLTFLVEAERVRQERIGDAQRLLDAARAQVDP